MMLLVFPSSTLMVQILLIFLFTNILFSLFVSAAVLLRVPAEKYRLTEIFLYCLGVGPILTTLLLYYGLLLFPHQGAVFYVVWVATWPLISVFLGRKSFGPLLSEISAAVRGTIARIKCRSLCGKLEAVVWVLLFCMLSMTAARIYFTRVLPAPVDEHDSLHYLILGEIYYEEKSFDFNGYRPYEETGFFSMSLHAPSFSLLHTWELMLGKFLDYDDDLYYKSCNLYYIGLLILIQVFWLSRRNRYLALLGVTGLMSGLWFLTSALTFHIDAFRIFFVVVSWIFLYYSLKDGNSFAVLLLGAFSGFAAFSHSMGVAVALINAVVLLLFYQGDWRRKVGTTLTVVLSATIFGGLHYVLDVAVGHGWILTSW
jgi:hypothetical protein